MYVKKAFNHVNSAFGQEVKTLFFVTSLEST